MFYYTVHALKNRVKKTVKRGTFPELYLYIIIMYTNLLRKANKFIIRAIIFQSYHLNLLDKFFNFFHDLSLELLKNFGFAIIVILLLYHQNNQKDILLHI